MNTENQFDAISYFTKLTETNKLAQEQGFYPCTCSGPDGIGGIVQQFQKQKAFVMIDDTTSQNTYSRGSGFFDKNAYTVFIMARFKWDDMADRERALNICRRLFRQFHSRMLHDRNYGSDTYGDTLTYLDVEQVYSKEFPRYFSPDLTGLYFMVNNDEPVDLTYNSDEWEE